MKTLWVKRTDGSSYFPANFAAREKAALEAIPGVSYLGVEQAPPTQGALCLLTNTHTMLNKWEPLRERVAFVLHPNSGMDNLTRDLPAWAQTPVVLGNPIRAAAVAEWTLSALFQHFSPVLHHSVWPPTRQWDRSLLRSKRLLLVGHGPVGQIVEKALQGLGLSVHVHDPHLGLVSDLRAPWDVVILLASLNPESRHLVDEAFLKHAPETFVLVNPARAQLVDENALRVFLSKHPQARAYLDVHELEPYPPHYWSDCPGVVSTPHIAGVWDGLIQAMLDFEVEVVAHWLRLGSENFSKHYAGLLAHARRTDKGWFR